MSDKFFRVPLTQLYNWIFAEERQGTYLGYYKENIFLPSAGDRFRMRRYGTLLETPVGVAAGPHTQLAQNIIASWLCGARYLELKTVQTLDSIHVTKPCIEMNDEGYNCEWSQELTLRDSFDEYLNAWVLLHILRHKLGLPAAEPGFIFNMSVGYDYAGILNPNVQWFLDKMESCGPELAEKINQLKNVFPAVTELAIPARITDNITISTMHGCPPGEIRKIAEYFISERKLHTAVKLNPTLLGPEQLRAILNGSLGYDITVPDEAFEHDLKYPDAVTLITGLANAAAAAGVEFGVKLTNTLESLNTTLGLPKNEKMVYTSGRALHPISIALAQKLQNEFNGTLDVSFSAGVDVFNVAPSIACGCKPVTVCSDILKPGGYLRLKQYMEVLQESFAAVHASSVEEYITLTAGTAAYNAAVLHNLHAYAPQTAAAQQYRKSAFPWESIKTSRALTELDCVSAPCTEACAISQNVSDYMYYTANGDFPAAYGVITADNALPNITGNVCDHLCQAKCTRMNYDNPLQIRAIKRFVAEQVHASPGKGSAPHRQKKAAVIGAGPSGLSCAFILAKQGMAVALYESKPFAGGMPVYSIPHFRLSDESVAGDMEMLTSAGVEIKYSAPVTEALFNRLRAENDFIYIGIGAQKSKKLGIPGEELPGVLDQLEFLSMVREHKPVALGSRVLVIGGGNSAIDAARTANRLVTHGGTVELVYRRTRKEMPADKEEIDALLKEGIAILELTAPVSVAAGSGKLLFTCSRMQLGEPDSSGRRRPVEIPGSSFTITCDTVITAIGQEIDMDFIPGGKLACNPATGETSLPNVFMGGDALRGADSLINAMGDGKKAALEMLRRAEAPLPAPAAGGKVTERQLQAKLGRRQHGVEVHESLAHGSKSFGLVHPPLTTDEALQEAARCLTCADICNICTTVCPNFANLPVTVTPADIPVYSVGSSGAGVTGRFTVHQQPQILHVRNFCNECGNCTTFCPTSGDPYKVKPAFHITKESYDAESGGYYFAGDVLYCKSGGVEHQLRRHSGGFTYGNGMVTAGFDGQCNLTSFSCISAGSAPQELREAAKMMFLFQNFYSVPVLAAGC